MHDAIRRGVLSLGLMGAALSLPSVPSRAAEPYDIDVVLPLTGAAASLGMAEQVALQKEEKIFSVNGGIAGRPVHFVFHDDQSSPQVAVQLANQIKGRKPAVILGSATVAMCNAMAPVLRNGPVLYCFSPALYAASGSNSFSASNATHDLLAAQLRFLGAKGWKRIALITSSDASGQDAQRQMKELIAAPENKAVELVDQTSFNPTDVSVSAQIQHMKAAGPQVMVAWSTGAAIGTVFKAMQDAGVALPVVTTDGNMTYTAMSHFADVLPSELYIPSPEWPRSDHAEVSPEVRDAKEKFFGAFEGGPEKPDAASSFAWDPAVLVVSALRKLGPDATGEQVRDYLSKLTGFAGIAGVYDFVKFPQRGLGDENVVVTRWDKGASGWKIVSRPRGLPLD
jgi:branched-chain amino acid transport system substrate-binding protein